MGYTESGQSRANQGIPRFACNPDLNHACGTLLLSRQGSLDDLDAAYPDGAGDKAEAVAHHLAVRHSGRLADLQPHRISVDPQAGSCQDLRHAAGHPVSQLQDAAQDQCLAT